MASLCVAAAIGLLVVSVSTQHVEVTHASDPSTTSLALLTQSKTTILLPLRVFEISQLLFVAIYYPDHEVHSFLSLKPIASLLYSSSFFMLSVLTLTTPLPLFISLC